MPHAHANSTADFLDFLQNTSKLVPFVGSQLDGVIGIAKQITKVLGDHRSHKEERERLQRHIQKTIGLVAVSLHQAAAEGGTTLESDLKEIRETLESIRDSVQEHYSKGIAKRAIKHLVKENAADRNQRHMDAMDNAMKNFTLKSHIQTRLGINRIEDTLKDLSDIREKLQGLTSIKSTTRGNGVSTAPLLLTQEDADTVHTSACTSGASNTTRGATPPPPYSGAIQTTHIHDCMFIQVSGVVANNKLPDISALRNLVV